MRVIATAAGHDGKIYRSPGDEFECPKNKDGKEIAKASWYKPVPERKDAPKAVGEGLV